LKAIHKITIILLLLLCSFSQKVIAQDTLVVKKHSRPLFKAEPMRATMLAVALPGLGQIYNRKYLKVPIVYVGFGAILYAVNYNSNYYNTYMKAYQDLTDAIPETDSYLDLSALKNVDPRTYDPVLYPDDYDIGNYSWMKEQILRQIDYNKKYRDLSYIGIVAWYLVTILDANVDASLFNYDVGKNLEVDVKPVQMPVPGQTGPGAQLSLRVNF
jgi:hypothetical protein